MIRIRTSLERGTRPQSGGRIVVGRKRGLLFVAIERPDGAQLKTKRRGEDLFQWIRLRASDYAGFKVRCTTSATNCRARNFPGSRRRRGNRRSTHIDATRAFESVSIWRESIVH